MKEKEIEEFDYTDEELVEILKDKLVKKCTISSLCNELNISTIKLLGIVKKLDDKGINISIMDVGNETQIYINNHPDCTNDNTYTIKEDINDVTKIGVISDLGFGSKNEQISKLNDMYKKFANDGVKYVIITGNLLEGKYNAKDENIYGKELIYNDGYAQADHFIEYFPKVEGIKTLFITGDKDHTWAKNLNVGEYIAEQREDLVYLGPKTATINFNNVSIKLESLKKTGESYTVAYPAQKYSRSMSSYEDFDLILLGGTLSAQEFPSIRDTRMFTIPSVETRSSKMKSTSQQNTMGCYEFEIEYNKTGKLKRLNTTLSPYYVPSKESYLTINPLELKKDNEEYTAITKKESKNRSELFSTLDRFYKLMKKEESFNSLKNRLGMNEEELFGIIDMLQRYGRQIEIVDINNELVVRKNIQRRKYSEVKPPKEELTKVEFGVVSDTHYGSIWCQPSMVNTFCYEAYNRGITDIYHLGDISDGDYSKIRPNHVGEVFLWGATGQVDYVAKELPKYPGMKWKGICGSHDQSHTFNYGPFDFGRELEKRRSDFEYLGQDRAFVKYDNCTIELFHPGGGTSRILSTKPQNGIDQIPSKTKPNLSLRGHYHKVYYMLYRNVHLLLCPCNVDQSSFMMKNELPNLMGDYFVTIWYDENGDIQYINTEPMIFSQEDVRPHDYENPKKYIKNKILTK